VNETVGMPPTGAVYLKPRHLTADAQAYNQVLVSFRVTAFQVFQKSAPPRDHREQSPAGMMIFAVRLEMILELQNTLTQDGYLYLWRTGVCFVNSESCHYLLLRIRRQSHARIDTPRLTLIFFVLHSIAQIPPALALDAAEQSRERGRRPPALLTKKLRVTSSTVSESLSRILRRNFYGAAWRRGERRFFQRCQRGGQQSG